MTTNQVLEQYSTATANLAAFELVHSSIIEEHKRLIETVEAAKSNVIDAAKHLKEDLAVGDTTFRFSQPFKKYVDYATAAKVVGPKLRSKLDEITKVIQEVDYAAFEALCKSKVFPSKAWVEAYREEALSPRVSVHSPKKK
jgi:hypothetical protein